MALTFPKNGTEAERQKYFIDKSGIVGKSIKSVRYMSDAERDEMGWGGKPAVIELNDGTLMFAMQDDEGNGAGCLNVQKPKSKQDDGLPVF